MSRTRAGRSLAARIAAPGGIVGLGLAAALFVPAALGHPSATTPKLVGNSKAGKVAFLSTCGACHTLKAAGAQGAIGPNLDKVSLTQALLIKAITNGGSSIMTKAQIAKYTTQMQPYKYLGTATINNISRYVYESTHKT
jgi:mono/diheme cytochrome c family protein